MLGIPRYTPDQAINCLKICTTLVLSGAQCFVSLFVAASKVQAFCNPVSAATQKNQTQPNPTPSDRTSGRCFVSIFFSEGSHCINWSHQCSWLVDSWHLDLWADGRTSSLRICISHADLCEGDKRKLGGKVRRCSGHASDDAWFIFNLFRVCSEVFPGVACPKELQS